MSLYDFVVLGGGPAGYSAALRVADSGKRVLLVERESVGGVCLNRGCVPAKSWIASAEAVDHAKWLVTLDKGELTFDIDFAKVINKQKNLVESFRKNLSGLLAKRGVEVAKGDGSFISDNTVSISGEDGARKVSFANALIATGTSPMALFDLPSPYLYDSSGIMEIDRPPESILIIGGGYVGCEFAGALKRFGSQVTVLEIMDRLLPMEDREISSTLAREFKKQGIKIVTGSRIETLERDGDGVVAVTDKGKRLTAQCALVSAGRRFNTGSLNLHDAGVETGDKGEVITDDKMRTTQPNIFAAGDVAGKNMLAYTAYKEGAFVADIVTGKSATLDLAHVPRVVFTIPEIGAVGVTSDNAPDNAITGVFHFRSLARAHSTGEISGFAKVIADGETKKLLGVHIIGAGATDMIHTAMVAIASGMTVEKFADLPFAHPTFAEAMMEAAQNASGLSIHSA